MAALDEALFGECNVRFPCTQALGWKPN